MRIKLGRPILSAAVAAAVIATAGVAMAASPIRGATYSGTITRVPANNIVYGISFKVSANGKKVSGFKLPNGYPTYCEGGGFGQAQSASAKVTGKGKFTAKLPIYFAPAHQHQGFVIVTGSFGKHGKVSGKVKTDFTKAKICNGTSSFSAVG